MAESFDNVVFSFEDVGDTLTLLPLAARRALDVAGLRLSLEGYQSLNLDERKELALLGSKDSVDKPNVERLVRRCAMPPTRIKPVADPDPRLPPEQLNAALGPRRAIDPIVWSKLRSLDRYALIHVMRRSIAHDDPSRLEAAAAELLPRPRSEPKTGPERAVEPRTIERRAEPRNPPPRDPRAMDSDPPLPAVLMAPSSPRKNVDLDESSIPMALRMDFFDDRPTPQVAEPYSRPKSIPPPASDMHTKQSRLPALDGLDANPRSGGYGVGGPTPYDPLRGTAPPALEVPSSRPPPARSYGREQVSTHLDEEGNVRMVDVGRKDVTERRATATGSVQMRIETAQRLARNQTPKGDVLATARVAGILAAKKTPELIPLCHHVALTSVEVHLELDVPAGLLNVTATADAVDRTGVEMEALTAVTIACLTVYDMLKGVDREMVIGEIKLVAKTGGKTGAYVRSS